jgi:hypothetical protein
LQTLLAAESRVSPIPFLIAGADDHLFLDLLGQVVASRGGLEAYRELCGQAKKSGGAVQPVLAAVLAPSPSGAKTGEPPLSLAQLVAEIKDWQTRAWLHPNWWDFTPTDVRQCAQGGQSRLVVQYLHDHREMELSYLENCISLPFLVKLNAQNQLLVAPLVAGARLKGSRWQDPSAAFLLWLGSAEGQSILARESGEAPTLLAIGAPDIQSRQVRDWTASFRSVQGFSRDGFTDPALMAEFATQLRAEIRAGKK